LEINGGQIGISLLGEGGKRETGSIHLMDSKISNVKTGIITSTLLPGFGKGNTLISLDNVEFRNVPAAVVDKDGKTILAGNKVVKSWTLGNVYDPLTPNGTFASGSGSFSYMNRNKIEVLETADGKIYERSRPQYENASASTFLNVKELGAKGDGHTDDTAIIQAALIMAVDKILYFPAGAYVVTDTIDVPPNRRIVGECWSQIIGSGPQFSNINAPKVMLRIGKEGQIGFMEISDMLFTSRGSTAGIVLMEWNIKASAPGAAGMWGMEVPWPIDMLTNSYAQIATSELVELLGLNCRPNSA
jgi:hypothetical protein